MRKYDAFFIQAAVMFTLLLCILVIAFPMGNSKNAAAGNSADPTTEIKYIGADSCKKCHITQHRTWKKMKHANAWNDLPEQYRNPEKKDEAGRVCMSCHVTGYGHADQNGFVDAETSPHLLGVQCEACHGPGSKHREAGQRVLDERRKGFKPDEPSYITRKTTNCADCHNPHVSHEQYKTGT